MTDPQPTRPDPGRDTGGSWWTTIIFMAIAAVTLIGMGVLIVMPEGR